MVREPFKLDSVFTVEICWILLVLGTKAASITSQYNKQDILFIAHVIYILILGDNYQFRVKNKIYSHFRVV